MAGLGGYGYRKCNSKPSTEKGPLLKIHTYRFKNRKKSTYIVRVEEFKFDLFAIKFYLQDHRYSDKKYKLLTNQFDARNIVLTCINIGLDIYKKNKLASFGFLGMPTLDEDERSIEQKYNNTKRHRVYKMFATFFFNTDVFDIHLNRVKSSCLLINKRNDSKLPKLENRIIEMFELNYNLDEIFI